MVLSFDYAGGCMFNRHSESSEDTYRYIRSEWWRRGRVDLSLKHELVVWVIDGWPAMVGVDDGQPDELVLARLGLAEEEAFELVTA
jgi:hypothetical protein